MIDKDLLDKMDAAIPLLSPAVADVVGILIAEVRRLTDAYNQGKEDALTAATHAYRENGSCPICGNEWS